MWRRERGLLRKGLLPLATLGIFGIGVVTGLWFVAPGEVPAVVPELVERRGLDVARPRRAPSVDPASFEQLAYMERQVRATRGRESPAVEEIQGLLRDAIATVDPLRMRFAGRLLVERIGSDVEAALAVVELIRQTDKNPDLEILLRALALSEAVRDPRTRDALLDLAESSIDLSKRLGVLLVLQTQAGLPDASLKRLVTLGAEAETPEMGMIVAHVIGAVTPRDPQRAQAYADALLSLAESPDQQVRIAALESLFPNDLLLEGREMHELAGIAESDPSAQARACAVSSLSTSPDRTFVLDTYQDLFARDPDPYVRWIILVNTLRAGGSDALPLLRSYAERDPYFQPDVADFEAILAAGYRDYEQIWLQKQLADERAQRVRPWELEGEDME